MDNAIIKHSPGTYEFDDKKIRPIQTVSEKFEPFGTKVKMQIKKKKHRKRKIM